MRCAAGGVWVALALLPSRAATAAEKHRPVRVALQLQRRASAAACPSEQQLAGLLADALSTADRDSIAQHTDGCASCQERLASLTENHDAHSQWPSGGHRSRGSEAEEACQGIRLQPFPIPACAQPHVAREGHEGLSRFLNPSPSSGS